MAQPYRYIKIADTEHGELGHTGWTWVLNHPYGADDVDHPAYYEETGYLSVAYGKSLTDDDCRPLVNFSEVYRTTRGGIAPRPALTFPISAGQARVAEANRMAYDAVHRPTGGYRIITD